MGKSELFLKRGPQQVCLEETLEQLPSFSACGTMLIAMGEQRRESEFQLTASLLRVEA